MAHSDEVKGNEIVQEDGHNWYIDLDIAIGMPCCGGPLFRPHTPMWTSDLSEANEDRIVYAAAESVRQAFEFARKYKRIRELVKGNIRPCEDERAKCDGTDPAPFVETPKSPDDVKPEEDEDEDEQESDPKTPVPN